MLPLQAQIEAYNFSPVKKQVLLEKESKETLLDINIEGEATKMEKSQEKRLFVEPKLIKGEKLDEVTFQPAGYGDPSAHSATTHHSFSPFPLPSFLSKRHGR